MKGIRLTVPQAAPVVGMSEGEASGGDRVDGVTAKGTTIKIPMSERQTLAWAARPRLCTLYLSHIQCTTVRRKGQGYDQKFY